MLGNLMSDVLRAARSLRRTPGLTVLAVAILAIGIGASAAMFSIVSAVLLSPMGITDRDRVVVVWPVTNDTPGEFSYNAHRAFAKSASALASLAVTGSVTWDARLTLDNLSVQVAGTAVSANFFDVLGAKPLHGRTFRMEDDVAGARLVLVLSHGAWVTYFGADPNLIGRTVTLREKVKDLTFDVVGVMPPEFFYPSGTKYWTPAAATIARMAEADGWSVPETLETLGVFHGVARIAPGVSLEAARTDASRGWRAAALQKVTDSSKISVTLTPLVERVFGQSRPMLSILMGAVLVVLLAGCANVSGLLLARGASRAREFAVRTALGATRARLVRQLFLEGLLLSGLGTLAGVAVAALLMERLVALSPADVPRLETAGIDPEVLGFASLATFITALVLTVVPAWHLRRWSISQGLQGASKGSVLNTSHAGVRRTLVVAQIAVGVVLLTATSLTVKSFAQLAGLDVGFNPSNVLTFGVGGLDEARYPDRRQRRDIIERLVGRIGRNPSVDAAAAVLLRPFGAGSIGWDSGMLIEGQTLAGDDWSRNPVVNFEAVTPGYFRAMGIRLLRGRDFAATDRRDGPQVTIISEALADRLWPGQNPIGKRLADTFTGIGDEARKTVNWQTVVGVVATVFYREIDHARFDLYRPMRQTADFDPTHFVVRTTGQPLDLVSTIDHEATSLDPGLSVSEPTTMANIVNRVRGPWQFTMFVFVGFGLVSVGLTVVGLSGLVAYTVAERRQEVGIRMALGAEARRVVAMFVAQGARLVVMGVLLGLGIAFFGTRLLEAVLFNVSPTDLSAFGGAAVTLSVVALLACYLPARRAASVDPATVFRDSSA